MYLVSEELRTRGNPRRINVRLKKRNNVNEILNRRGQYHESEKEEKLRTIFTQFMIEDQK